MPVNFLALPEYKNPDGLDVSGLSKAFGDIADGKRQNRLLDIKEQSADLDKQRFGMEREKFDWQRKAQEAERWGQRALAIDQLQGPARQAAYERFLSEHPNAASLPAQYRDPINGPRMIAAEAGQMRDQLKDQLTQSMVEKNLAEATKDRAMAAGEAGTKHGLIPIPFRKPDGSMGYMVPNTRGDTKELVVPGQGQIMPKVSTYDLPTEKVVQDQFGNVVRREGKDIIGKESQEEIGKKKGQFEAGITKAELALKDLQANTDLVNKTIDEAVEHVRKHGRWAAGIGSVTARVPESPAFELNRKMDTIKSNIGFDKLQAIRDASPTGGALGAVSDAEQILLQSTQGSFNTGRDPQDIINDLLKLKQARERTLADRIEALSKDKARFMGGTNVGNSSGASDGWMTLGNGVRIREKR